MGISLQPVILQVRCRQSGGEEDMMLSAEPAQREKQMVEWDTAAVLQTTSEKMRAEGFQVRESHFWTGHFVTYSMGGSEKGTFLD